MISISKNYILEKNFQKIRRTFFEREEKKGEEAEIEQNVSNFFFFRIPQNIHTLKEFKRESAWTNCVKFIRKQHERLCPRVVKTVEIGGNNAGDGKLIGFRGVSGEFDSRLIGYFLLSPVRARGLR